MTELFFFDKEIFNQLPKEERSRFHALLSGAFIPEGRPFILDDDCLPNAELEGFWNYLLGPRRGSTNTWQTYASQVTVFIRFMQAQGKTWRHATQKDLDLYYTVRTTGEFQSKPPIKGRSWNVAKAAIVHLYEYALDEGLIAKVPFKYRKSKAFFGGKVVEIADLGAKYTPEPINFISVTNYKNLWRPLIADGENSQRNQVLVDRNAQQEARALARPKVVTDEAPQTAATVLGTDSATAEKILRGDQDVLFSSCKDFYNRPGGQPNTPCDKPWGCFLCSNAIITRHVLPRVVALRDFIQSARHELSNEDWSAKFGLVWHVLTNDVLPRFPLEAVAEAERLARDQVLYIPLAMRT